MAVNPNRYNRTTEAYDFALFETKPVQEQYTVHRKKKAPPAPTKAASAPKTQTCSQVQIYRVKKQRSKAKALRVVVCSLLLVTALGAMGSIIYNQVCLTELTQQIDTVAQELEESKSVFTQLQMRSNANLSLATVESFAKERLGMRKIDQSQLVFVELSKGDKGEVIQSNHGDNFLVRIWNSTKNLLS